MTKSDEILKKEFEAFAVAVTVKALRAAGVAPSQLTYSEGCRQYGSWFKKAVEDGRIAPCRIGEGDKPTKYFAVDDICKAQAAALEKARLVLSD